MKPQEVESFKIMKMITELIKHAAGKKINKVKLFP